MTHFYATLTGKAKSDATACAHKTGSIQAHIKTYSSGIFVTVMNNGNEDEFFVYKTNGTNGERKGDAMTLLYQFTEKDN